MSERESPYSSLQGRLRRWADARDKRYEQNNANGAHGKTGTALLRSAADVLDDVQGNVYLWGIGEIDAEAAIRAVRDAL